MVLFSSSQNSVEASAPEPIALIHSRFSPWLTPLVYSLARWVVLPFYFGRIEITGQEHLPGEGAVILAPTHRSRWDAIIVAYATGRNVTGRDVRFMVSADECKGFQGWLIRRLGGFPVNTLRPTIASLRHGVEVLQNREMLVIFPEGGIFRDDQIHSLKPGLARLAMQATASQPALNIQVVPITIQYSDPCPQWRTRVSLRIDRPLQVESYSQGVAKQDACRLTHDLTHALEGLMGQSTKPLTPVQPHSEHQPRSEQKFFYLDAKSHLPASQATRVQ
jgi:1-acyl-sn-glycerol-3-phosphate acyltransferase